MNMEVKQLVSFQMLAREGHMTRAAQRLGLSQPALTRQVQALEAELGVPLTRRVGRRIALTAAGEALANEAAEITARLDLLPGRVRDAAAGLRGRLRVGLTHSASFSAAIVTRVRAFRERWPGVQLDLQERRTPELLEALTSDGLDLAFVRSPLPADLQLHVQRVAHEALLVALPARHPLVGKRRLRLSDLDGETMMAVSQTSGGSLLNELFARAREVGVTLHLGQNAAQIVTAVNFVAAGLGLALVPERMMSLRLEGVEYRALEGMPDIELLLVARPAPHSAQVAHFLALNALS